MKAWFIAILVVVIVFLGAMFGLGSWLNYDQMASCQGEPDQQTACGAADVVVAVSGGDTNARALRAVQLYKEKFASKIIFSGAAADPKSPSNAAEMAKLAEKNGVPSGAILLDETSRDTNENAANAAKILLKNGWTNVILVSENYHLRRVYTAFINADNQATFRTTAAKSQPLWWVTPRGWVLIVSELGGMTKTAAKVTR